MAIKADLVACLFSHTPLRDLICGHTLQQSEKDGPAAEGEEPGSKRLYRGMRTGAQTPERAAGKVQVQRKDLALRRQVVGDMVNTGFDIFRRCVMAY